MCSTVVEHQENAKTLICKNSREFLKSGPRREPDGAACVTRTRDPVITKGQITQFQQ
jgi:hypothetical protein